jgi:hypothetical protein
MIVPSMTIQEIHNEIFEDIKNIENITNGFNKDFRKLVLKKSRYPLTKTYEFITKEKKNLFLIGYTALKRSDWANPIMHFQGIYTRPEGKYAVAPSIDLNISTIYPPHFFKRYRERIVKDNIHSNDEIIKLHFTNNWGLTGAKVNKDYENVYNSFEDDNKNERIDIVAATSQGYCFGEKQGNINIIKTIISEDMLFEDQKFVFHELRKIFNEMNRERYGKEI